MHCYDVEDFEANERVYSLAEIKSLCRPVFEEADFVERVYLFGSYARGEAGSLSDLDFMVVLNQRVGLKFFGLYWRLEEAFCKEVDVLSEEKCIGLCQIHLKGIRF